MKKFTVSTLALFVGLCALPQISDAAQMALQLKGDAEGLSYFAAPDKGFLDEELLSAFTVEAWVNPAVNIAPEDGSHGGEFMIVNKEDSYEISVRNTDLTLEGTFQAAIQPIDASWAWTEATEGTIPANKWTHVAATYDGLVVRTYVNGKLTIAFDWAGVDGVKGALRSTDATLKVGRRVRGAADHSSYNGLIDEVRISRVIRYTEAGFPVPTKAFVNDADTVALFHFDEATAVSTEIAALKAKFEAAAVESDFAKEEASTIEIKGIVKDASTFANHGALIKDAVLVAADTPITE